MLRSMPNAIMLNDTARPRQEMVEIVLNARSAASIEMVFKVVPPFLDPQSGLEGGVLNQKSLRPIAGDR